jgi:cell division protein FtsW (lipid II flippase)
MLRRALSVLADGGVAWLVVLASLALCTLSIVAIDLATPPSPGLALPPVALKQAVFAGAGLTAAILAALPHYRTLGYLSNLLMGVVIALLIFLLIPFVPTWLVKPRNGARGWIDLGPIDFQPAELAKIAYVVTLAWYMRYRDTHRTFSGLLPPALIAGVPMALIILQPDLGTAMLFVPVLFAVLVAAGAKLQHLAIVVCFAMLCAPAVYPILKPHQKARIVGLLQQVRGDTSADLDINMQSATAKRLIGAGQIAGAGEHQSRVLVNFSALPERHNDMIFAVIINRYGLMGGVLLFLLYAAWIGGAFLLAGSIREPFARLVVVGLATFITAQVFINVGMNLGLLPIIGITLPFVSYGGSSMLSSWIMTGIILGIAIRRPSMPLRRSFEYADRDEDA